MRSRKGLVSTREFYQDFGQDVGKLAISKVDDGAL